MRTPIYIQWAPQKRARRWLILTQVMSTNRLVFANTFDQFEFGLMSWLGQKEVGLVSPLSESRFETVKTIGNAVDSHSIK
jgi:hypothetical protein